MPSFGWISLLPSTLLPSKPPTEMKIFVVAMCLLAAAAAAPAAVTPEVAARRALPALHHEEVHDAFGQYMLRYMTAEGTIVEERGRLVPTPDGKAYVLVTEGSVTYIGDDGKTYIKKYSAGFDGVKVEGNHLPVAPTPVPIPDAPSQ